MPAASALALRFAAGAASDGELVARLGSAMTAAGPRATLRAWRDIAGTEVLVYALPAQVVDAAAARAWLAGQRVALGAAFGGNAVAASELERVFAVAGASHGAPAPFHYVVETGVAPGWEDELAAWYDTEHMPGLAAVPGCVRAQRYLARDGLGASTGEAGPRPRSYACYDLTDPATLRSAAWLTVRGTAWSGCVRPRFRDTRRAMYRGLPLIPPVGPPQNENDS